MISVRLAASRVSACGKIFNSVIFSDIIRMINVEIFMMVLLVELYLFIPPLMTLTVFQKH